MTFSDVGVYEIVQLRNRDLSRTVCEQVQLRLCLKMFGDAELWLFDQIDIIICDDPGILAASSL